MLVLMAEGRPNTAIRRDPGGFRAVRRKHVSNIFSKPGLALSDADHRRVLAVLRYLEP